MRQACHPAHRPVLICFSHLRWAFVTQRPQHLLNRAASDYQVTYWEEPHFGGPDTVPHLRRESGTGEITVLAPILPWSDDASERDRAQRKLLDIYLATLPDAVSLAWFYTPMAMGFADHVAADLTLYDCMDELAAFAGASPRLEFLERRLLRQADLVFTGGHSLQRAKQTIHPAAHCFPSSVDISHYARARSAAEPDPADQACLPHPRIGFFGVLDERLDTALVQAVAALRPDWQIILVGPTAKIDPTDLPRAPNIHWLGSKRYSDLPAYLAHWDAGLMPFAQNDATRYISPTKTPEFLAAGLPLVCTPITDVVESWSDVVSIAAGPEATVSALQAAMDRPRAPWLAQVDFALDGLSWDASWGGMRALIAECQAKRVALAGD